VHAERIGELPPQKPPLYRNRQASLCDEFGVSAGGITAAQAMYEDPRITAGVDVDGSVESPLVPDPWVIAPAFRHGLRQPFMFMGDPLMRWFTGTRSFHAMTGRKAGAPASTMPSRATGGGHRRGDHGPQQVRPAARAWRAWRNASPSSR
jgi:hypothetical protein